MTIEHVAACDACGENDKAIAEIENWVPPNRWITVSGLMFNARHFCSWACVGNFVVEKMREEALAGEIEAIREAGLEGVDRDDGGGGS